MNQFVYLKIHKLTNEPNKCVFRCTLPKMGQIKITFKCYHRKSSVNTDVSYSISTQTSSFRHLIPLIFSLKFSLEFLNTFCIFNPASINQHNAVKPSLIQCKVDASLLACKWIVWRLRLATPITNIFSSPRMPAQREPVGDLFVYGHTAANCLLIVGQWIRLQYNSSNFYECDLVYREFRQYVTLT